MDEIDIAKVRNYAEAKIIAPMNVQEQKALCRLVLDISDELKQLDELSDKFIKVGEEYPIFKSELEDLVRQHKLEGKL